MSEKDVYIPENTLAHLVYKLSETPVKKALYKRAMERGTIFSHVLGIMDPEKEKRMVMNGEFGS